MVRIPYKQFPANDLISGRIQVYFGPVQQAEAVQADIVEQLGEMEAFAEVFLRPVPLLLAAEKMILRTGGEISGSP